MTQKKNTQTAHRAFRQLVQSCIESYKTLLNDSLTLDLNRVDDLKVRSMILQDAEYRRETKYIRAQSVVDEINNINKLEELASGMGNHSEDEHDESNEENWSVRGEFIGKKKNKQAARVDKDALNMQFKAAIEKRELIRGLAAQTSEELDAMNVFFITVSRDEFEQIDTVEVFAGDGDDTDAVNGLVVDEKEKLPDGIRDNLFEVDINEPEFTLDEHGDVVAVPEV